MILNILQWPDPLLYTKSTEVVPDEIPKFQKLILDMSETMYSNDGVGLSAIQVGVPLSIIVMDIGAGLEVYVNPIATLKGSRVAVKEACLSVQGVSEYVTRSTGLQASFFNEEARFIYLDTATQGNGEYRAHVLQHEIDHCNGELFVDLLVGFKRERALKKLRQRPSLRS